MSGELERVQKALRELGKSLYSAPGDLAPENVHRLRTSSRRVEAIATVFEFAAQKKSRRLVKSIAPLRKAAGGVRDMDVHVANARKLARYCAGESLTHLLAHLEIARQQNARELQHAMHRRRPAALEAFKQCSRLVQSALKREKSKRAKSSAGSSTAASQSQERIHSAAMHFVRELGDVTPLDAQNLHEFRLKVKNLRYTLQLDENADHGLMAALGDVQRRIGDWHDWQQLEEIAHEVLVLEQDQALLDRIDRTAKRRFEAALAAANALHRKYLAMPMAIGV
ncbi:MAG: CHAD domain-containing protein [Terracidiphilus sp.]|jgi:CHAD domain-containing protein